MCGSAVPHSYRSVPATGPQIAALPYADAASEPDNLTLQEVNLFEPQLPGEYCHVCFSTEAEPHS
jgi:hypothetical protein